jgi:hypothetical protein
MKYKECTVPHFFIANCRRLMTRAEMVQANLEKDPFVQPFIKNVELRYVEFSINLFAETVK